MDGVTSETIQSAGPDAPAAAPSSTGSPGVGQGAAVSGLPSPNVARYRWLYGGIWLFYLVEPAQAAAAQSSVALRVFGLAALVGFGAWYMLIISFVRSARWWLWKDQPKRGWTAIGILGALALLTVPACGGESLTTLVYLTAAAVMVLPTRQSFTLVGAFLGGLLALNLLVPAGHTGAALSYGVVVSGLAVWGVQQMIARNVELSAAQQEIARLAVTEERARTARDLHDILGHSLTVITVKAELAGRLIRLDPARAEREVNDLERLSREALADVRRTVSGHRSVTLTSELVSARAALDAAGIEADLPTAVDEVPGEWRELFGWVVREGTTNIVRHSGAEHCVVTAGRNLVEIADDGRGPTSQPADTKAGSGLAGLRERVERAGGVLTVGRSSLGGFLLRVSVGGRPR